MRVWVLLHKAEGFTVEDEPYVVDAIDEHSFDAGCVWDGDLTDEDKQDKHGPGEFRVVTVNLSGKDLRAAFIPFEVDATYEGPTEDARDA